MKLNYKGDDTYKTQFGGFIFLMIAGVCIFLTVVNQFPNGMTLSSPISFYSLQENATDIPSIFEHSDEVFVFMLYNKLLLREANQTEYAFFFRNVSVWNIKGNVPHRLQLSTSCS